MVPKQILCEFHVMDMKSQGIDSKGSFYSAIKPKNETQIAGVREEGGSIPWAKQWYQMKSASHSSP